jgi:hypothetical protein
VYINAFVIYNRQNTDASTALQICGEMCAVHFNATSKRGKLEDTTYFCSKNNVKSLSTP